MGKFFSLDWQGMFMPSISPLEIIVRGTLVYLGIFIMLRVVLKRESSSVSRTDMLVLVLLADAAQNGMAGEYKSITDGLLLVAVIIAWSYLLQWLSYHIPVMEKLLEPAPLLIIKDGQILARNLRQELITREDLNAMLREQGVEDPRSVKRAHIESNGQVSIVKFDEEQEPENEERKKKQT